MRVQSGPWSSRNTFILRRLLATVYMETPNSTLLLNCFAYFRMTCDSADEYLFEMLTTAITYLYVCVYYETPIIQKSAFQNSELIRTIDGIYKTNMSVSSCWMGHIHLDSITPRFWPNFIRAVGNNEDWRESSDVKYKENWWPFV